MEGEIVVIPSVIHSPPIGLFNIDASCARDEAFRKPIVKWWYASARVSAIVVVALGPVQLAKGARRIFIKGCVLANEDGIEQSNASSWHWGGSRQGMSRTRWGTIMTPRDEFIIVAVCRSRDNSRLCGRNVDRLERSANMRSETMSRIAES